MANAEAVAERLVGSNRLVQLHDAGDEPVELLAGKPLLVRDKALRVECGAEVEEREAAAQGVVEHSERAVRCVHHADEVDVARDIEQLVRIEQLQRVPRSALVVLDEHEQLTEDLREVTAVDLVNDEEVVVVRVVLRLLAEAVERALLEVKALRIRAEPLDEVLVAVALVELHHHHALGVLHTHHGIGQALCGEGLAHARGALQDDVLLRAQDVGEGPVALGVHVDLREKVLGCVRRVFDFSRFLLGFAALFFEERAELFNEVGIGGDVRQGLPGEEVFCLPLSAVRPAYLADVRVGVAIVVELVVPLDDAAAYDHATAPLREDDIARLQLTRELPERECGILLRVLAAVQDAQALADVFLASVLLDVAELAPADAHDAARVEVVPPSGAVSRGVGPVVRGPDTLVSEGVFLRFHSCCLLGSLPLLADALGLHEGGSCQRGEVCIRASVASKL